MTVDRALTPSDAEVAIRSFPRRFRAIMARPGDDDDERLDPDEAARRTGPDGRSAADHLARADALLAALDEVLAGARGATRLDAPDVGSISAADPGGALPRLLDRFEERAERTANRFVSLTADDFATQTSIGGSLLATVQDVVGAVAAELRATRKALDAVR
jgi:hypothetical protein